MAMTELRVLIIDDEEKAISYLKQILLQSVPEVTHIQTAHGSIKGFDRIKSWQPDLVLLDIEMPFMNGFELLAKLDSWDFGIIYTTAFNQYAIQAIKFSALDYLLKPIDPILLKHAISKFIQSRSLVTEQNKLFKHLLTNLSKPSISNFTLALPNNKGTSFIRLHTIIRIEADGNYSHFHFTNNSKLTVAKTLKEYSELLRHQGFIRIHKSHLVNRRYIKEYLTEGKITLQSGKELDVSRRRRIEVKNQLKNVY